MSKHITLCQALVLAWAAGIAAPLTGCGRTLVFGERDGVNLSIRANASSTPPLEVNFGLDRVVATIVPPAGESNSRPIGEAVNMFAGFQVERYSDLNPTKPLGIDLQITTQFASGDAAVSVASNPTVVNRIVNVSGPTITRDSAFVGTLVERQALVLTVRDHITADQAVAVASEMAPMLAERSAFMQASLSGNIPPNGRFTAAEARSFLTKWAALETLTPAFRTEWSNALAQATK